MIARSRSCSSGVGRRGFDVLAFRISISPMHCYYRGLATFALALLHAATLQEDRLGAANLLRLAFAGASVLSCSAFRCKSRFKVWFRDRLKEIKRGIEIRCRIVRCVSAPENTGQHQHVFKHTL